nr:MAG TPA: hypothetical protein [Caudoviricetes sp.]
MISKINTFKKHIRDSIFMEFPRNLLSCCYLTL